MNRSSGTPAVSKDGCHVIFLMINTELYEKLGPWNIRLTVSYSKFQRYTKLKNLPCKPFGKGKTQKSRNYYGIKIPYNSEGSYEEFCKGSYEHII